MQKLVDTQKSTNNPMSSFGSIEENMELSDMAVIILNDNKLSTYCVMLETFM